MKKILLIVVGQFAIAALWFNAGRAYERFNIVRQMRPGVYLYLQDDRLEGYTEYILKQCLQLMSVSGDVTMDPLQSVL